MTRAAAPSKRQLLGRVEELAAQVAEREQLLLDLEVHREEVRLQNERLQETQRVLEESRDRYADLYDFAPLGYLTLDAVGGVLELNLTAAAMLGCPRGQLLGMPLLNRIAGESRQAFLDHMLRCRRERDVTSELELLRRDGSRLPVEIHTRKGEQAGEPQLLTAMTDLSERQRSRSERDRLLFERERERAASDAKGRFLAILSHELRTPLTPILATVSGWQRAGSLPAELAPAVAMIRRNVELEARLIDDLLDLTRIEHGKLTLERYPIDLHEVLRRVVDNARAMPGAGELRIELEEGASRPYVLGDPARLQQVFGNLVGNAVKFTPAGGWVRVTTSGAGAGPVAVKVADSGIGIAAERLATLFQPFTRGGTGTEPGGRLGGLGLGLAIARGLVDAHGGTISALSPGSGSGTTLVVQLPTTAAGLPAPTPPPEPAPYLALPAPQQQRTSVLLVEDHADSAEALSQLLQLAGYEVTIASSVREALDAVSPAHRLLISDLALPDGSGRDLLRRLRDRGCELTAIVLSGFGTDEDVRRSLEAGFREHLVKPVDVESLLGAVRRLTAA